tara:strand:- start:167 stop:370 length:204 start_codon:yes stop_codon:yes gene_type:complete
VKFLFKSEGPLRAISGHSALLMITSAPRPKRTKRFIESNGKNEPKAVGGLISFSTVNAHILRYKVSA